MTVITLTDVALRDGLQNEPMVLGADDKVATAEALVAARVRLGRGHVLHALPSGDGCRRKLMENPEAALAGDGWLMQVAM